MERSEIRTLAQNDVMNVRMEGLILSVLVEKGILTSAQAHDLVLDVIGRAPRESALAPAYRELLSEFQR